ncbi:MAG TPA: T9SS type A sorting domain-containing protein [Chitinophagaceae bacterium]|nr:T9SS type A sorting domain-containing protein [Chitinophagaceae bacterium]
MRNQVRMGHLPEQCRPKLLLLSLSLLVVLVSAAQRTASVSGNWSSTATWGGASVPTSSDAVTINAGVTVTVDVAANAASLTLNGTLNLTSGNNLTINSGGSVTINNGGSVVFSSTSVITGGSAGSNGISLSINAGANITTAHTTGFTVPGANGNGTNGFNMNRGTRTWTYDPGANYTFNGTAAQSTGTAITSANNLTVNNAAGVTLSTGTTVSGTLALTAGTLTVGANTLTFSGTAVTRSTGNIDASNASAVVNFTNGSAVSLPASTFTATVNLLKSNTTAGVSLGSATTVATLTIGDVTSNSLFSDAGNQITSTGTLNLTSGTFQLGSAGAATTFPGFTTRNISSGTTVEYAAGVAQTVSTTPTYQNLTFSGAGTKTVASGTLTVTGNWVVSSATALNTNNPTVTVGGNINGSGNITNGSGTINIAGNWVNSGSFTQGSGTVNYSASGGGQTVAGLTYNHLTLSNSSGTNTVSGNVVVNGTLTTTSGGTLDLTAAYTLSGTLTTILNSGKIKTSVPSSASTTPIPAGKTWGGTVEYAASSGNQTVVSGTYNNLTLANTSGTNTAGGAITVNGTLSQAGASASLDMSTYALGGSGTMTLSGTLKTQNTSTTPLPAGLTWSGTVEYNGSSAQTIVAGTYNNLTVSSSAKTLGGTVTVTGTLNFSSSIVTSTATNLLVLNDNATTTGAGAAAYVNGPLRKVGNDAFTFPVGKSGGYGPIAISAPSLATDAFTAEYLRSNGRDLGPLTAPGLIRISSCEYWELSRTAGSSSVNVTLIWGTYNSCQPSGYITQLSSVTVAHFDGTNWSTHGNNGGTTGTTSNGTVTWNSVNTFSPFALGSTSYAMNPLPVKFTSVRAFQTANGVQVDWSIQSESNLQHYEVQRSANATGFTSIGIRPAAAGAANNFNYSWVDLAPIPGKSFYRIRAVDIDGKISYSPIVMIDAGRVQTDLLLYPNPVRSSSVSFQARIPLSGDYFVSIYDMAGKMIYKNRFSYQAGITSQSVQLPSALRPGVYQIRVSGEQLNLGRTFVVE